MALPRRKGAGVTFQGKVIWITGASSGIGEALAYECARRGGRVVVTARRVDRLQGVVQRIRAQGGDALALAMDVGDDAAVAQCVAQTLQHYGRIDVAVANAGFGVIARFEDLSLDDYRRQFDTNIYGVLRSVHAVLPALRQARGQLVIMGSVAGFVSAPGSTAYSMSKFAIRAFADGLRGELAPSGVGVTLISPAFVESEIRKVDNYGAPRSESEPLPPWLVMPVTKAARQMADAIERRRPELIVTPVGKLLVFLSRHCSGLVRLLLTNVRRDKNKRLRFGSSSS